MTAVLVGIGGALGSIVRYALSKRISAKSKSIYPLGTFLINLSGALLLGVVMALNVSHSLALLFATGFLGAYTTFSTFMYEIFNLYERGHQRKSALYMALTLALGLLGFALGYYCPRLFVS